MLSCLVLSAKTAEISKEPLTAAAGGTVTAMADILVDLDVKRKTLFTMEDVSTDVVALLTELLSARLSHGRDVDDFMFGWR